MKKFLSVFLAVTLFFNSGFYFTGVMASIVPIPLLVKGNETFPLEETKPYSPIKDYTDPTQYLYRITALENLLTSAISGQSPYYPFISFNSPGDIPFKIYDELGAYRYKSFKYTYDDSDRALIAERIVEINAQLKASDERISDLENLIKDFILQTPLSQRPNVSGVSNYGNDGDIVYAKQEINRANRYKAAVNEALDFWSSLNNTSEHVKITSIPSRAMTGEAITINGEGFQNAIAVTFTYTSIYYGNGECTSEHPCMEDFISSVNLSKDNVISNNRIDLTIPDFDHFFPNLQAHWGDNIPYRDFLTQVTIADKLGNKSEAKNIGIYAGTCDLTCPEVPKGCTLTGYSYENEHYCPTNCGTITCPNNDSCKCPPGQVSFRNRCIAFDVSRVRCSSTSAPVCGCDGVTYTNRCEAMKAGLKNFTSGECGRPVLGQ